MKIGKRNSPLSFKGMSFEEAVSDLLKVKTKFKPMKKIRGRQNKWPLD